MSESYDTLKNLPRVPHAEGNTRAPIQTGTGGIPPYRKYIDYGEAVDIAVAAARLKDRQKGNMEKIPGGLDDEDPRLYSKPSSSGPFSKMQVAQGKALTPEDVARVKSGSKVPNEDGGDLPGPRAGAGLAKNGQEGFLPSPPAVSLGCEPRRGDPFLDMGGPAGEITLAGPDGDSGPHGGSQLKGQHGEPGVQVVYVDRPVEKVVEKIVEKDSPFTEWSKRRVRVHFTISETMFMVSAIDVVRSVHGLTVILPADDGGMLFIPKVGASVVVECKSPVDIQPTQTVFTGVTFDISELGIMGLAFLIPKGQEA